ncbi:MAG: hypothetical protein IT303_18840 [Dehalococcoidia bacterium]|nr:hypothetical protein [Dehalococcoidia bacterium]
MSPFDDARTATAVFTCEELWLLQGVIRHEVAQGEQWRYPPASLDLNDQIAESLLRCADLGIDEAALVLSLADALAIDYCVPQSAKSPSGVPIGKNILMKSFRVRREIELGSEPETEEPGTTPSASEVQERLRQFNGG